MILRVGSREWDSRVLFGGDYAIGKRGRPERFPNETFPALPASDFNYHHRQIVEHYQCVLQRDNSPLFHQQRQENWKR